MEIEISGPVLVVVMTLGMLPAAAQATGGTGTTGIWKWKVLDDGTLGIIGCTTPSGVNTYSFGIPVPSLSSSDGQRSLTLHTDLGSITVPANMLTGVENVDGSKAQIAIGQGDPSALPETVRTAIGNHPLIRLTLSVDGEQTAWNNPDAPVTVAIPYTPTAEELADPEHIVVWYIDPVIRLAGVDGVETALAIARAAYPGKVSTAVLTTDGNYPDALAGSVLASRLNAPILLVGDSDAAQKKILDYLALSWKQTVRSISSAALPLSVKASQTDSGMLASHRLSGWPETTATLPPSK